MDELISVKRFSQACENNKTPILAYLKTHFKSVRHVLEIGSGTGQHAAFFASALPHITWQPTDVIENHPSIEAWIAESKCTNTLPLRCFFFGKDSWNFDLVDAVFSANTTHIMQRQEADVMMQTISKKLPKQGIFCQYGPFKIGGQFTSESNRAFDLSLRERGYGGIRDVEELQRWAVELELIHNYDMPANNQLLVWQKHTAKFNTL